MKLSNTQSCTFMKKFIHPGLLKAACKILTVLPFRIALIVRALVLLQTLREPLASSSSDEPDYDDDDDDGGNTRTWIWGQAIHSPD